MVRTEQVPTVRNNLANCGEYLNPLRIPRVLLFSGNADKPPAYDKFPLNCDVFDGVPMYSEMLSSVGGGDTQNNPGNNLNDTNYDTDHIEEEIQPDHNYSQLLPIFVTFLVFGLFV